ncbi:MAG: hypothetical protein M0Q41_01005 [Bacteroidales bacterium]|nr:hypothetical protein [Bacteroidales bacterium]
MKQQYLLLEILIIASIIIILSWRKFKYQRHSSAYKKKESSEGSMPERKNRSSKPIQPEDTASKGSSKTQK